MINISMPELKKVEALARQKEGCISLAQGTLRVGGVDKNIKEYARQILLTDKADYYHDPLGMELLRRKIAETLSEQYHTHLSFENVMVSHGSIGALTALCLAKLDTTDEVILPEPTYPVYKNVVTFSKANPVLIPAYHMKRDLQGLHQWFFDIQAIKNKITRNTKMLILSNPSNPLGICLSRYELAELKALCIKNSIYLVIDEIYDDFVFEGEFYSATASTLESEYIIMVGSFSKNFGMSGWRCGYLIAQPHIIRSLASTQACALACPTVISQYGALYALEHKRDILEHNFEKVAKSRDFVCSFFDQMQEQGIFSYVKPKAGFYLFFRTHEADSFPLVMNILEKSNVAMAPGFDFGASSQAFIRLCYARDLEVVEEGIRRIQAFFLHQRRVHRGAMMSAQL